MPRIAIRSTIDVRQLTLCEYVFAFASSMASTSTTGIVDAGAVAGVGAAAGAVEELPPVMPPVPDEAVEVAAGWLWPKMAAFSLSKMPIVVSRVRGGRCSR